MRVARVSSALPWKARYFVGIDRTGSNASGFWTYLSIWLIECHSSLRLRSGRPDAKAKTGSSCISADHPAGDGRIAFRGLYSLDRIHGLANLALRIVISG